MPKTKSTEVVKKPRDAIAEFDLSPAAVQDMAKKYLTIAVPEGDRKAFKIARAALTTVVSTRTATDKRRKELGSDARKWIAEVNQAAKDLLVPLVPVEAHLSTELNREIDRIAALKAAEEAKEAERVAAIQNRIAEIRAFVGQIRGKDSAGIKDVLESLRSFPITDEFQEFRGEAEDTKITSLEIIEETLKITLENEEAARAERERLENIRKVQEAEAEKALKALKEEKARIESERKKLENEKARLEAEEQARKDAEAVAEKYDSDWVTAHAENERITADRAIKEEAEAHAKAEAEKAEKGLLDALRTDKEKLLLYAESIEAEIICADSFKINDENAEILLRAFKSDILSRAIRFRQDIEAI